MSASPVLFKTDLGRAVLRDRALPQAQGLNRARRSLLIMVDGRRTLRELGPAIDALGLVREDLQWLVDRRLMRWGDATGSPVLAGEAGPTRPAGNRSVAGAKLYALDLLGRLLAQEDAPLREAARAVTHDAHLMPWLRQCAVDIARRSTEDRAALFLVKVQSMVPEHLLDPIGDPA
ncbi:hypothetical protein [Leptothrix discophora]|uniref:Uncharacterized protein n=1 Tax=Leptothrix discophora TaxID=89 RepID=A0ABT9G0P1_LEPDI|nr:hypothetical protein [Leptothrix discophora]MDP4300046.1 hypothetical protein [Leptothrix discophora]